MLGDAGVRWADDSCYRLAASLTYYALFSIFPLLLLSVTAVGFFLGTDPVARQRLLDAVSSATSPQAQALLDQTLQSMQGHQTARGVGAVVGIVTLLVGASGVFSELQFALNKVWRVEATPSKGFGRTILLAVRDKAVSFAVVVGAAVLLLILLMVSTAVGALSASAQHVVSSAALWWAVEFLVSLALSTLIFAAIFHMIPQTRVLWHDVLGGALLTAFLFTTLKHVLAWYLAHLANYSAYGAVGAVLGLMTWIYLVSAFLLFGAEFARVYSEQAGSLANRARSERRAQRAASPSTNA
jgi:membrane protein